MARPLTAAKRTANRLNAFIVAMAIVIGLIGVRAVWVQGIDAKGASAQALARLQSKPQVIPASRGVITDRNGEVLAQTLPFVRVVADPYGITRSGIVAGQALTDAQIARAAEAPDALANILMSYLGGSLDDYLGHLTCPVRENGNINQYQPIAANVPAHTWAKIQADMRAGGWYGLYAEQTPLRVYPDGSLMANVLGFVGAEGDGLEGVEMYLNSALKGTDGVASFESSIYGRIPLGDNTMVPPVNGNSVRLTIDAVMQAFAQQAVEEAVASAGADFGVAIVLNVKTGEILAMANAPTFDSNDFGSASSNTLGNRAIRTTFEPGSVQKVLTMAALLDQGLITPETRVKVPARVKSGAHNITDAWGHGTLHYTARGVLANSSNIGTVLLSRKSSKTALLDYMAAFGLGATTGVQLPGEATGLLDRNPPDYKRDRMSFGQSLSVTPLQEAAAIASVVNGGVYNQPTIIAAVIDSYGAPIPLPEPETRQVISPDTSAAVVNMMQSVTESAQYRATRSIPGYSWIGKTGTAERYDSDSNGYRGITASFVGVGPTEDPQILVYVVLDNPSGGGSGSGLAMPPAKDLMQVALPRYGVLPSAPTAYKDALTYKP